MRKVRHGFNLAAVRAELDQADWEPSENSDGLEVRRVWLGTTFGLTPSGKVYQPFACGNVAGDCKVCGGTGERPEPRHGRRARKRARARELTYARRTLARDGAARSAYVSRVRDARRRDHERASDDCACCGGAGSASAARDERWNDAAEVAFESIGATFEWSDDSAFAVEYRDAPDETDDAREAS